MCYSFIFKVKQSIHTSSGRSGYFEFLFGFRSAILLSKTKSLFFDFSNSPSVTNLSIDYGGKYELVDRLKDFHLKNFGKQCEWTGV